MTSILPSQKPSARMGLRVIRAAKSILRRHRRTLGAVFEHGHWWVTCSECGGNWDAVDAEGGNSVDGFDFEEVTAPEDGMCEVQL